MQTEIKAHRLLSPEERENLKKYYLIRLTEEGTTHFQLQKLQLLMDLNQIF